MTSGLVIGGTGFIGRHTVANLLGHGYDVTTLSRRTDGLGATDGLAVDHVTGDRTDGDVSPKPRNASIRPAWADDLPGVSTHHDYWIDRIDRYDRVVVPGDGTAIWHRVFVEDVAEAIRVVAERGERGEAYNVADRHVCTLEDVIGLIAQVLDTSVEVVHASRRELAEFDLDPNDFVLYHHQATEYPHVLDVCKLASLGWEPTPVDIAMERTVEESLSTGRDGSAHDPGRDAEERVIEALAG